MSRLVRAMSGTDLLLINLCSIVLVLTIYVVDAEAVRIVLGLPFVLFFPGYVLIAALFPRSSDLGTAQRVALSIGFSIIIAPLVGLLVNIVWEIQLYPIVLSLTIFIAAMSVIAWYSRSRVPQSEVMGLVPDLSLPGKRYRHTLDTVVSVIVAVTFLGAIVTLGYVVANPRTGEEFTEFYIVGAENQPSELAMGNEATVVLGIINREHDKMSYQVDVLVGGSPLTGAGPIELDHGGTWEGEIGFVPGEACARTSLVQDVNNAEGPSLAEVDGVEVAGVKSIQVASTDHLEPGDHIWVGQEAAQIQEIADRAIMLDEVLKEYHPMGTEVIEVQKVEFRLHKIRKLGQDGSTSLSLWLGKDHLSTSVLNQGYSEAVYRIEVRVDGNQTEETRLESIGPIIEAGGEGWAHDILFPFSEINEVDFSLYNDGELLYQSLESASYPSVYVWAHVGETSPAD
jgi:uncharacterized membrane protein